jgi:hypothetical protein
VIAAAAAENGALAFRVVRPRAGAVPAGVELDEEGDLRDPVQAEIPLLVPS